MRSLWAKYSNGHTYHALVPFERGIMYCQRGGSWPLTVLRHVSPEERCKTCVKRVK